MTGIDDSNRDRHHFLSDDDRCVYFGEFFSNKTYKASATNQLIKNFKRTPSEISASPNARQLQYYKDKAINEIAVALRKQFPVGSIERYTFVPIPSSKMPGHADYCDRLLQTLKRAFPGFLGYKSVDIRSLLRQTQSTEADHRSGSKRLKYDELLAITEIDNAHTSTPLRQELILFDDVITSGKHYKVAKQRIRERFPDQVIWGMFVARAIHADDAEDFEPLDFDDD